MTDNKTHSSDTPHGANFGYRDVPPEDRQGLVNEVFDRVASRYDLMNDLMSGGLHRLWKQDLITALNPPRSDKTYKLLDVAGGTGDIALRFLNSAGANATAVLCDINQEMLRVGVQRIAAAGLSERITPLQANAQSLPVASNAFDAYTIAFGIRNVTDIDAALCEAFRVLKIGGRFLCLEFSHVDVPILDSIYDFHSFEVIPRLGKLVANEREPYQYLVESIRNFPVQDRFTEKIRGAGFERVSHRNLTGGIAAIHSGWKL